ncbi:inositol-3-phosphate synthase [Gimesia fumaroli]|uniref:Inositol-3-phosphate synthase n=1 Tax=Gimesia fumaroli TaxID=2527976 RepID=A0A518I781_9PLAN|nr:inositol-3-phosphate synthase [Gimesia fumaroli]QDV48943.1 Inositol-3-phosphate synthase [Gimesia fumaroli]
MTKQRIGIWIIGAWGGVSTTAAIGLLSLQKGLTGTSGLVSEHPYFEKLDLVGWDQVVIGGHEIRETSFVEAAKHFSETSGVFHPALLQAVEPELNEFDKNVKPGTLIHVGDTIRSLAGDSVKQYDQESLQDTLARLSADMTEFQKQHDLAHVVVVNLASTEPPVEESAKALSLAELKEQLASAETSPVPASALYAIAAMNAGCSHLNFTPSAGTDLPALIELAEEKQILHGGRDGKTGETLMKSVLAPMFAHRNLNVMSWVGHNIFGNLDGKVLDDPVNKSNKVHSKDHLLTEILGYKPQTLVSIEYIESMGDWKTAWDHIHFKGFLDTKMSLQFTWQGTDSVLAAPLVLDMVRFTEREWRRGNRSGVMTHLSSFFKSPMQATTPEFERQYQQLEEWANTVSEE